MYKTVRHGENSLQYTILPQQDESTGNAPHKTTSGLCRGRQTHRTRRGRTTTILIVTLLLVCSIVAGTILVPLLLTTDIIAFRKLHTSAIGNQHVIHHHIPKASFRQLENLTTTTTPTTTTAETTVNTLTTINVDTQTKLDNVTKSDSADVNATTVEVDTTQATTEKLLESTTPRDDVAVKRNDTDDGVIVEGGNGTEALLKGVISNTRIFVEASMPSERNKTTEIPVEVVAIGRQATTRPTVDPYRGWLPPRWPFADPSTYLQWTGYNSGHDSLLLPLLLSLVLLILILIMGFCYFMRRRHQKFLRREAIGKMASDLQNDEVTDKASLLPELLSEEE